MADDRAAERELAYLAMFGLERVVDVLGEIEAMRALTAAERRAGRASVAAVLAATRWWADDETARRAVPIRHASGTHWTARDRRAPAGKMIASVRRAAAAVAAIGGVAVIDAERTLTRQETRG